MEIIIVMIMKNGYERRAQSVVKAEQGERGVLSFIRTLSVH